MVEELWPFNSNIWIISHQFRVYMNVFDIDNKRRRRLVVATQPPTQKIFESPDYKTEKVKLSWYKYCRIKSNWVKHVCLFWLFWVFFRQSQNLEIIRQMPVKKCLAKNSKYLGRLKNICGAWFFFHTLSSKSISTQH